MAAGPPNVLRTASASGVPGITNADIAPYPGLREIDTIYGNPDIISAVADGILSIPTLPVEGADEREARVLETYNQLVEEVKAPKVLLVRNADTLHDFGKPRGDVPQALATIKRKFLRRILAEEKSAIQGRGGPLYAGVSNKFSNMTQVIEFEDLMFEKLSPPQATLQYVNSTPENINSPQYTRMEIDVDTVLNVNQAHLVRNAIYSFLGYTAEAQPLTLVSDASPSHELTKVITTTTNPGAMNVQLAITPETIMDSGGSFGIGEKKFLPGFVRFQVSHLSSLPRITPVFSASQIQIQTTPRTFSRETPTSFDITFMNRRTGANVSIPHEGYTSGPGVEYITKRSSGVGGNVKSKTMPLYDLLVSDTFQSNARAIGVLDGYNQLTPLGRMLGYDIKREGDQAQALSVLMWYRMNETVALVTSDRMLALFMVLMGGPVILEGKGKITVYRGTRGEVSDDVKMEMEHRNLLCKIVETIAPVLSDEERGGYVSGVRGVHGPALAEYVAAVFRSVPSYDVSSFLGDMSRVRDYLVRMYDEYSPYPYESFFQVSHLLLVASIVSTIRSLDTVRGLYERVMSEKAAILDGLTTADSRLFYTLPVSANDELKRMYDGIGSGAIGVEDRLRRVSVLLGKIKKANRTLDKAITSRNRFPAVTLDFGPEGFVDVRLIRRLNRSLERMRDLVSSGNLIPRFFDRQFDTIREPFGEIYSRLSEEIVTFLQPYNDILSEITAENVGDGLSALLRVDDRYEAEILSRLLLTESPGAAAAATSASASASEPRPPRVSESGNIRIFYELCVRCVSAVYASIQPVLMTGSDVLNSMIRAQSGRGQSGEARRPDVDIRTRRGGGVEASTRSIRSGNIRPQRPSQRRQRERMNLVRGIASKKGVDEETAELIEDRVEEETVGLIREVLDILSLEIDEILDDCTPALATSASAADYRDRMVNVLYDLGNVLSDTTYSYSVKLRFLKHLAEVLTIPTAGFDYDSLYDFTKMISAFNTVYRVLLEDSIRTMREEDSFQKEASASSASASASASSASALRRRRSTIGKGRISQMTSRAPMAQTRRRSRKCPPGTIRRKAYTTKKGTHVRSTCIKDLGKKGKGPKLFTLKKGGLSKYGYSLKKNEDERHSALTKARKAMPHARLVRRINALGILMKNTHPLYSKRARSDVKWLGETRKD